MKWQELLSLLREEVAFRSSLLLSNGEPAPKIRRQLARWTATGRLQQLRRGVYAIAPPYRARVPHPFVVARILRPSSYISLQSALAHYGLIPEHVPVVTSVTTGRPETLDTPLGRFVFRHISRRQFLGYESVSLGSGDSALVALPEKALLDLIHFAPQGQSPAFLEELRLQNLGSLDVSRLRDLANAASSPKLRVAAERIVGLIEKGGEG